jgi:hypothetical protein
VDVEFERLGLEHLQGAAELPLVHGPVQLADEAREVQGLFPRRLLAAHQLEERVFAEGLQPGPRGLQLLGPVLGGDLPGPAVAAQHQVVELLVHLGPDHAAGRLDHAGEQAVLEPLRAAVEAAEEREALAADVHLDQLPEGGLAEDLRPHRLRFGARFLGAGVDLLGLLPGVGAAVPAAVAQDKVVELLVHRGADGGAQTAGDVRGRARVVRGPVRELAEEGE